MNEIYSGAFSTDWLVDERNLEWRFTAEWLADKRAAACFSGQIGFPGSFDVCG
jgi:hypothetical protein